MQKKCLGTISIVFLCNLCFFPSSLLSPSVISPWFCTHVYLFLTETRVQGHCVYITITFCITSRWVQLSKQYGLSVSASRGLWPSCGYGPRQQRLRLTGAVHNAVWCTSNCPDISLNWANAPPALQCALLCLCLSLSLTTLPFPWS